MVMKSALSFLVFSAMALATPVADSQISGRATAVQSFKNTRWTWQNFGLGACGITNVNSDFVVALAPQQFGSGYPGPQCFHRVTLHYGGISVNATVTDESPGDPDGGMDLTPSLFQVFANLNDGIIYGDWELY